MCLSDAISRHRVLHHRESMRFMSSIWKLILVRIWQPLISGTILKHKSKIWIKTPFWYRKKKTYLKMTSAKYVIQGTHPVRKSHHFGGMGVQENWVELENSLRGENKKIYGDVMYSISQEICTRFCCALLCCGYAIVHNEFTWSIYPYSSGLLCWHWGNR